MHRAHDAQVLQAAVDQRVQKRHMAGQILHVGGGIMAEAVAPSQMDADVRAAQLAVQVGVTAKQRHIAELGALVDALEVKIRRNDAVAAVQRIFYDMAANVARCTGNKNRFHNCSSLTGSRS